MLLKFIWKCKGSRVAKQIGKRNKFGWHLLILKLRIKLHESQSQQFSNWGKGKHIDQWNTIESVEIKPGLYGQLIFTKKVQGHSMGKG